ncbi:phage tail tape measure protein [Bilifractor sp. LCP19S3_H10]|uniref:phage tail tape measure protein n=1 Tax=Lachnospiraceae TaxID=186803 RepID=UPI003F9118DA
MADRIKGITVEIGGDTTKLSDALKGVNKSIRQTQDQLRDVNKLLKLDPGNADLLVQKQKYLSEAISDTKEKLKQEQDALKQLQQGPQTEETFKQQEALTREIENTKQSLEKLKSEFKDVGSVAGVQLQQTGQKMKDVGDKIAGVGTSLSTHVTAPIAAVGAASLAAFKEVDEGADIVTQKTGASGKALKEMQDAANDIATTIPTDFATAGSAIGEVNTRFGLTGEKLKDLSQRFVEFASLNDTDVSTSIDNVSSVLNAFGMDASQTGGMLDVLNSVGQATGLSMDTLSQDLSQNAAQLQAMGLNATQSAQFLGNVEMSGLDVGVAMAGMKKAMKEAAGDGKTLDQALKGFSDTMHSNKSDTEKLQAAYDLFGSKAGASIYNAMQTGKLSLDGFSSDMSSFSGNVSKTFDDTLDPIDKFKTTLNQLKVTGAEIGNSLSEVLAPMLSQAAAALKQFAGFWEKLPGPMQQFIVKAALVAAAVGPVLVGIGKVTSSIGTITSGIGKVMTHLGGLSGAMTAFSSVSLLPMIGIIAAVVAAVVAVIAIIKNWGTISNWFKGVWEGVCSGVKAVGTSLSTFFTGLWNGIQTVTTTAWNGIKTGVSTVWNGMKTGASSVFNGIKTNISNAWNTVKTNTTAAWSAIKASIASHSGGIKGIIRTAMAGYQNLWKAGFQMMNQVTGGKLGSILATVRSKMAGVKLAFSGAMESAKTVVSGGLARIRNFFSRCRLQLPHIKLPHFSISGSLSLKPPSVPHLSVSWYKKAMDEPYLLQRPTIFGLSGGSLLGGGEAGEEAVVGTRKLQSMIAEASGQDAAAEAIVTLGNQLMSLMREYYPQMVNQRVVLDSGTLVGSLAPKMNEQLGRIAGRKARG